MSIFDYEPIKNYSGRGSFECLGSGIEMDVGDIAFKCNFAHMDPETSIVTARRVCRQFPTWGMELYAALDHITIPGFEGYEVFCKPATEHRAGVKIRGPRLSAKITGTDPIKDNRKIDRTVAEDENDADAVMTAALINAISDRFYEILRVHPVNLAREAQGLKPANILLMRGAGTQFSTL